MKFLKKIFNLPVTTLDKINLDQAIIFKFKDDINSTVLFFNPVFEKYMPIPAFYKEYVEEFNSYSIDKKNKSFEYLQQNNKEHFETLTKFKTLNDIQNYLQELNKQQVVLNTKYFLKFNNIINDLKNLNK